MDRSAESRTLIQFPRSTGLQHARITGRGYEFGEKNEYRIRVASAVDERIAAWRLVRTVYEGMHYAPHDGSDLWYGIHDAIPSTTTFAAGRRGDMVAALSLVFDGPMGLPADALFGAETRTMRRQGKRLCEIVSLVNTEKRLGAKIELLKHMFKLAYVTARELEGATDFIITVNPHHVAYYRRALLFGVRGGEKTYEKVSGAPAVLLGLDLRGAETTYRERFDHLPGEKNFYRFFKADLDRIGAWLNTQRRPLRVEDVVARFIIQDPPLGPVTPGQRAYVRTLARTAMRRGA